MSSLIEGDWYVITPVSGPAVVGECVHGEGKYLSFAIGEHGDADIMFFVQKSKKRPEIASIERIPENEIEECIEGDVTKYRRKNGI